MSADVNDAIALTSAAQFCLATGGRDDRGRHCRNPSSRSATFVPDAPYIDDVSGPRQSTGRAKPVLRVGAAVVAFVSVAAITGVATRSLQLEVTVDANSTGWDVLTAIGTLGATGVALWLAVAEWLRGRTTGARLVSAWVTDDYEPAGTADHYRRRATLHIANESDEPVFNAHVVVIAGAAATRLGPLSAPSPIAVLPPRRELTFDLSVPLLAHDDSWNPRAAVTFGDRAGRRWIRDEDGTLRRVSGRARWADTTYPEHELQLGNETLNNPMMVAMWFLAGLREGEVADPEGFELALAPEASGWVDVDWETLRATTADFQPTSMVDYLTPYIARVKLSGDVTLQGKTVTSDDWVRLPGPVMHLTLTYAPDRGWRVFGIGDPVPPDKILFPKGTFLS